ncbi:MAG: GC-type dockerin domain-anchored protein [Phycisphaerales bacterium JB060]
MKTTALSYFAIVSLAGSALAQGVPEPLSEPCDCLLKGGSLEIIDLSQPGFAGYTVNDLNNVGQVLMRMAASPGGIGPGFVWQDGAVIALRSPPPSAGGSFDLPVGEALNDAGQIAGFSQASVTSAATVWASPTSDGVLHYLQGQDPATDTPAPARYFGISPSGVLAGHILEPVLGQAVLNRSGGTFFEALPRRGPGSACTELGDAVDDRGVVVGFSDNPDTGGCGVQATIWDIDGQPDALPGTSSFASRAYAINEAGQVAVAGGVGYVVDLSSGGAPVELAQLNPQDINAAGVVAGRWPFGDDGRMWYGGAYVRLIDRVDPAEGWTALGGAVAINDSCWMVGLGTRDGVEGVPYLVMPGADCVEPCAIDYDGDGVATIFDFLAFQNLFAMGDLAADFDGDGSLTLFDFLAFQNAFVDGCP